MAIPAFKGKPLNIVTGDKKLTLSNPKTALITGASRRIGAAIARDLARQGTQVLVHYSSSEEAAAAVVASIKAEGGEAVSIGADLMMENECKMLFEKAAAALGPIDLIVNNASIFEYDSAMTFNSQQWDRHFALHVKAPSLLAAEMAAQSSIKDGLIVNIIDQRVERLNPNYYSYTLSKSALWTATRTLAQTLAPKIRVNAIAPGPSLPNKRQSQADFATQINGLILKRGPQLDEFGATVRYFWNMRSVTGQMIALDGGQHLAWETPDIAGINE